MAFLQVIYLSFLFKDSQEIQFVRLFLIDGNKVTIKESSIRRTLRLDDEEGASCLANDDIFTGLANMGYEKIALVLKPPPRMNLAALWHQQLSVLPQTRSLTSPVDHQLGDMSHHQDIYDNPSLTKKVFANMKRDGTGFSRVITSLFENMLVPAAEEVGQAQYDVYIPTEPSTSKPHKKHKSKKQQPIAPKGRMIADMDEDVEVNLQEAHAKAYNLDLQHSEKVLNMQDIDEEEPAEVEEVLKVVKAAKRMTKVVNTAQPTTTAAQSKDKGKGILIEEPKPLKGQAPSDIDEAFTRQLETKLNTNINWNDVVEQVKKSERQNNKVMRYQALKRNPLTEAQARTNMIIYLNNIVGFKIDFFKGMTYSEIRPIFEKHYNSIQTFLEEEITVQEKVIEEEGSKRQEDTPLASKLPVVDYQIHHENNKPYYKIIRADGTHKLFLSFITLLKNFNREYLDALWKLVKERFETIEPKNFSDDFLLNILKIMFEKLDIEANV
nr:hypothetical protein [Tanacetum cinerariifolium]